MRLNNLKNIELLRKGLYSQELSQYAGLCYVYSKLIISSAPNKNMITDTDIQNGLAKYSDFLAAASRSDFTYLERHSKQVLSPDSNETRKPDLTSQEVELFKQYSYHSQKLKQFSTASELLGKVITKDLKTQKPVLSESALKDFEKFMSEDAEIEQSDYMPTGIKSAYINFRKTSKFLDFIKEHSPRWLGNRIYHISSDATKIIHSIDPECLPKGLQIDQNLTPAAFGAEITGVKGSIKKFFDKFKQKTKNDPNPEFDTPKEQLEYDLNNKYNPLTDYEKDYFRKRPSNAYEAVYSFTDKVCAKVGSLSKAQKAIAAFGLAALLVTTPVIETATTAHEFNSSINTQNIEAIVENIVSKEQGDFAPITIENLSDIMNDFKSKEYESVGDFKEDGHLLLDAFQTTCQTYLNRRQVPTLEEAKQLVDVLDEATSYFVEKQLEFAIYDAYPDYTNVSTNLFYDDTVVDPNDFNKTIKTSGVEVSATNADGVSISTVLERIDNPLFANDLFQKYISMEKSYDKDFKTFYEALSNPNAINPKTGKTYTYQDLTDLSNEFFEINVRNSVEIGGYLNANIEKTPKGFSFVAPKKEEQQSTTSVEEISTTNETPVKDTDDGRQ